MVGIMLISRCAAPQTLPTHLVSSRKPIPPVLSPTRRHCHLAPSRHCKHSWSVKPKHAASIAGRIGVDDKAEQDSFVWRAGTRVLDVERLKVGGPVVPQKVSALVDGQTNVRASKFVHSSVSVRPSCLNLPILLVNPSGTNVDSCIMISQPAQLFHTLINLCLGLGANPATPISLISLRLRLALGEALPIAAVCYIEAPPASWLHRIRDTHSPLHFPSCSTLNLQMNRIRLTE